MADKHRKNPVVFEIDEDALVVFIAKKLGLDEDTVEQVLGGELVFLDERGLVVHEDKPQNEDKVIAKTADVQLEEIVEAVVLRLEISPEIVRRILNAEADYMSQERS